MIVRPAVFNRYVLALDIARFPEVLAKPAQSVPRECRTTIWSDGLFVITPAMGPNFVEALPVERFHGVGPATAARMKELGIFTALDLRAKDETFLLKHFGKAASEDAAYVWDAHLQTMSAKDLLSEVCARLPSLTKLTRDEMRLAGYPDSMPEIDVCTSGQ